MYNWGMTKKAFLLSVVGIVAAGAVISITIIGYIIRPKKALLQVQTEPVSTVIINGVNFGRTPIEEEIGAGEITISLNVDELNPSSARFDARLNLEPGIKTIVRRRLGETRVGSSGEIITLEPTNDKSANLSFISIPDGVKIFIDDNFVKTTPAGIKKVEPKTYNIMAKKVGFLNSSFQVIAEAGFTTKVMIDLMTAGTPPLLPVETVVIENTPNGFLRVREKPSQDSDEIIDRVSEGISYEVLGASDDGSWIKINTDSDVGWISSEYTSKDLSSPIKDPDNE